MKLQSMDPEHLRLKMFDCKKLVAAFGDSGEGKLLNLVQSMVYPESWKNNGKHGCGEASVEGGILIVNQSEVELRQIGVMLTDLRGKVLGETEAQIKWRSIGIKVVRWSPPFFTTETAVSLRGAGF